MHFNQETLVEFHEYEAYKMFSKDFINRLPVFEGFIFLVCSFYGIEHLGLIVLKKKSVIYLLLNEEK